MEGDVIVRSAIIMLLSALVVNAQIASDAYAAGVYTASGANTWTHTTGSGANRLLIVGLWSRTADGISSPPTYNGVSMTLAVKNVSGTNYAYIYYLANPASGAHTVSVSSTSELIGASATYTGAGALDNTASATNASWDPPALTMTINTVNSWIFSINANGGNGAGTPGAGSLTKKQNMASSVGAVWDSNGTEPAGSVTFNDGYLGSNQNQTIAAMSFAPFSPPLTGGQSISLGSQSVSNTLVPNTPTNRMEMMIINPSASGVAHIVYGSLGYSGAFGWSVQTLISGSAISIQIQNRWETSGASTGIFNFSTLPAASDGKIIGYIRAQHNPATKTDTYEAWDVSGNQAFNLTQTYTAETNTGTDLQLSAGGEPAFSVGWIRFHSTLVPAGSQPPVTYNPANAILWWKFDGDLSDSSGNGYTAALSGGSATYASTATYQSPPYSPISILRSGTQAWGPVSSMDAGRGGSLDGKQSYSQSDTSASVTCFFQQLAGPSFPTWNTHSSCSPTLLSGLLFGDYLMQNTVTDASGNIAASTAHVGSVAQDTNGVVVQGNSAVPGLLGDMIAFGKNPWGYADYWHLAASNLRKQIYEQVSFGPGNQTIINPQWEQTGSGIVNYYWNGTGPAPANTSQYTTLNGGITATALSITVADATKLDLTSFPTRLIINAGASISEEVRICSASSNVLTVCYDGRGQNTYAPAAAWSSGTPVGQFKISGTGTRFLTDSTAPICPVGAGPPGTALYSIGTVTLTAGSSTITTTASWDGTYGNTNGFFPAAWGGFLPTLGAYVRIPATHSGTAFTFIAQLATGGAKINNNGVITITGGAIVGPVTPYYVGSGYTSGHVHVTVVDSTGSGAVITPTISGGAVTAYTVNSGGSNYTNPSFIVWADQLSLNRAFPADADSGTYSYSLLNANRTMVLRSLHVLTLPGTNDSSEAMWQTSGCESETDAYSNPWGSADAEGWFNRSFATGHDVPAHDGQLTSGFPYSVTDTNGWVNTSGTGGITFYGECLANTYLYLRSGLTSAKTAASEVCNTMAHSPWGNRDVNGYSQLFVGGLALEAFYNVIANNNQPIGAVSWNDLRAYAADGISMVQHYYNGGSYVCDYNDSRNQGYAFTWLILAALYDPDTTSTSAPGGISYQAYWRSFLPTMLLVDQNCATTLSPPPAVLSNSWPNASGDWNINGFGTTSLTLTHGSTAVTGTGISQTNTAAPGNNCYGVATGTGSVVSGSSTLTISTGTLANCTTSSCPTSVAIVVADTSGQFAISTLYHYTGGSTATLGVQWPYSYTGNVVWMSTNPGGGNLSLASGSGTAFGTSPTDYADLSHNYACIWNSGTSVTLSHPWQGATASNYGGYSGNISGYGQQPFMLGIKTTGMAIMASSSLPQASAYQTLVNAATSWITAYGVDASTLTTNYGRIFGFCEPTTIPTDNTFDVRAPGCNYGSSPTGEIIGREQNQELGAALAAWYQNSPTGPNKTFGDQLYGAVWGSSIYNTGGVFQDANTDANNVNQTNLKGVNNPIATAFQNGDAGGPFGGKWYGFFTGVGNASKWPAVRVGGVLPAINRSISVGFNLASVSGASKVTVTATAPSGASASVTCTTSPCTVMADARQSNYLLQIQYLSSGNVILAKGDPFTLVVQ